MTSKVVESEVCSLSGLVDQLSKIEKSGDNLLMFRGAVENYGAGEFTPSLYRSDVKKEDVIYRECQRFNNEEFHEDRTAFDKLSRMQHYQAPTRVLDLSEDLWSSVYFALGEGIGRTKALKKVIDIRKALKKVVDSTKDLEEVIDSTKALEEVIDSTKALEEAIDIRKTLKKVSDTRKALEEIVDSTEALKKVSDTRKALEEVVDSTKSLEKVIDSTKNAVLYILEIDESKVKYYDSDAVSVISNLAKIPLKNERNKKSKQALLDDLLRIKKQKPEMYHLRDFNACQSAGFLLHEIKEEKPYFEPIIDPDHLTSIQFVWPKLTSSRLKYQKGAFLLFGLNKSDIKKPIPILKGKPDKPDDLSIDETHAHPVVKVNKIILSKYWLFCMWEELKTMGIKKPFIYPEIDKVSEYLQDKCKG